jgi:ArsR family transcriptional regulator
MTHLTRRVKTIDAPLLTRIDVHRYASYETPVTARPLTRLAVLASAALAPPSVELSEVATILRVLGDPTRLGILAMLAREQDALCVCHVEARFALSQPTISHHLRVLREARLVTSEKRGSWVHYSLDRARAESVPGLSALLAALQSSPATADEKCCP